MKDSSLREMHDCSGSVLVLARATSIVALAAAISVAGLSPNREVVVTFACASGLAREALWPSGRAQSSQPKRLDGYTPTRIRLCALITGCHALWPMVCSDASPRRVKRQRVLACQFPQALRAAYSR
jgi:hypothetical protein